MRGKWVMQRQKASFTSVVTSARQCEMEPRGTWDRCCECRETPRRHHSSKFLQTFPSFISLYGCNGIYTWRSVVVNTIHPFLPLALAHFLFISAPHAPLSLCLTLLSFISLLYSSLASYLYLFIFYASRRSRISLQVNIPGIYVNKLSSGWLCDLRLNSLDGHLSIFIAIVHAWRIYGERRHWTIPFDTIVRRFISVAWSTSRMRYIPLSTEHLAEASIIQTQITALHRFCCVTSNH